MGTLYNRVSGQSLERLGALADGVFAVAMTLLILDIHVPAVAGIHSESDLIRALAELGPRLLMYAMSFMTLGIFWNGHQTQLHHLERTDRDLAWIHIGFLATVCLVPFSTTLLAQFIAFRTALIVYWANIFLIGAWIYGSWLHADRAGLVRRDAVGTEVWTALRRRVLRAQTLYAFGALLCVFSTYWSIAFILLVQLNYAIAPKWKFLAWTE
jgi:uncharacterized membrane protein